jgi:hypothetical protein
MKSLTILLCFAGLILCVVGTPTVKPHGNEKPSPVRPFTVQGCQSPYPSGTGLTGLNMNAIGGNFFIGTKPPTTTCAPHKDCGPGNVTVLWVDSQGKTWLVSSRFRAVHTDLYSLGECRDLSLFQLRYIVDCTALPLPPRLY